jgi:hypothetical protein
MNKYDILTNEQKVIVLTSRLTFSEDDENQLENLKTQHLNWHEIIRMSTKNKVLPLVWSNLSKRGYLSKEIIPQLRQVVDFHNIGTRERNKVYLKELDTVVEALRENSIRCVPLKGGYLLRYVYKDLGIRTVNDMDLMISRTDISKARVILKSLSYIEGDFDVNTGGIIPPSKEKLMLWKTKMYNMYPIAKMTNSDYARVVSLDFSFSMDLDIKTEPIDIMLSRSVKNQNDSHYYLKPSDFFIHQCCHHYREATNASWVILGYDLNLIKFCDVREYIIQEMTETDFDDAIRFAKEHGYEKAVYFTLYYLNEIYGDGYENAQMEKLEIHDSSFLNYFGEKDFGYNVKWKKNFWERIFADSNKDEINEKTKYAGIVDIN